MFLNMATPTSQCSHTFAYMMNQHGVDYSRITLRFSITRRTTIFQMVLLLKCPEGMQHTTRLHLTVITCPTIMTFIRLMALIPSCKLIIIHPFLDLAHGLQWMLANIYMITYTTFAGPSGFPVSTVATSFLKPNKATSLLGFIT